MVVPLEQWPDMTTDHSFGFGGASFDLVRSDVIVDQGSDHAEATDDLKRWDYGRVGYGINSSKCCQSILGRVPRWLQ